MAGFATLVADIREDINRGTTYDARIKKAIQNAIQFYRARRYGFNQKTKVFTASTEFASLTANWIEVDAIYLDTTSGRQVLKEDNWPAIDDDADGRTSTYTARPCRFAVQNRLLRFDSPPDRTYSVHMSYMYDLKEISICASDSASNGWTNEGFELIKTHAIVDIIENYIGGDEDAAKALLLRNREKEIDREMKRRANREQGAGSITPWF